LGNGLRLRQYNFRVFLSSSLKVRVWRDKNAKITEGPRGYSINSGEKFVVTKILGVFLGHLYLGKVSLNRSRGGREKYRKAESESKQGDDEMTEGGCRGVEF